METKQCSKCKKILPYSEFRWRNKNQGKLHSQCKECEKIRDKEYYRECSERRNSVKNTAMQQKTNNQKLVEEYRSCGCQKCGEKRPYVLDFHHLDQDKKENNISRMIKSSRQESLLKELKKCIVLCSNCHREFHYFERVENITIEEYLT